MDSFKKFINEAVDKKMTAENGSSLRSSIIKHHGGVSLKNYNGSNPYADYKQTSLQIPKDEVNNSNND